MVKVDPKKVEEELKKQQEFYGDDDEDYSSATDPDKAGKDTEEDVERVIGNPPEEKDKNKKGFSIAEQIEEDEEDNEGVA